MPSITSPADHELMSRFGLTEEQWETIQDHGYQLLTELINREYPPILAQVTLQYACHLAAVSSGLSRRAMIEIDADNGQMLFDAARWHFDEIHRATQVPASDPGAGVGVN